MSCVSHIKKLRLSHVAVSLLILVFLSACNGPIKKEASYPTQRGKGSDKIRYSDQKRETIWAEEDSLGNKLFGGDDEEGPTGSGIGVNSFLWRATLDTISFMPVTSADPFGGTVITDWYENPEKPGERFKLNVYILDRHLKANALRVSVFKQKLTKGKWRDIKSSKEMPLSIENSILTRAREMRISQMGIYKN